MAKRTTKKQTANQREYAKQVKRIKQAISRAVKRGYMFADDILPQKPKRVTAKAIERLKEITTNVLYSKAEYVDFTTGEIMSGEEGVKQERKERARKASETRKRNKRKQYTPNNEYDTQYSNPNNEYDTHYSIPNDDYSTQYGSMFATVVISNYKAQIRNFNDVAYNMLSTWLDGLIAKYGEEDVAIMLNDGAENGNIVTYKIVYSHEKLTQYVSNMLDYLPEVGEISREEILEAFEQMEDWESPQ